MTDNTKTPTHLPEHTEAPKQPGKTSRSWCWTLNNPTEAEIESINSGTDKLRYIVYGRETCPTTGTPHLQGYLEAKNAITMAAIKKLPGLNRVHLAIRRGTREQAREYCLKDGVVTERGNWEAGGQGRRTDWQQLHAYLKENPEFSKAREEYPEECIKYTAGIRAVINDIKREQNIAAMDAEFEGVPLYRWQAKIIQDLQFNPDKRKVIWVVDPKGNRGKTWFAKYLLRFHGSAYLQNGKSADLAHAYNGERVVTFDFCRSNEQATNYQIIEQIKNGMVFSPKYDSMTKINAIPHVICFSNFEPNRNMLSEDRWDIRVLTDESCTIEQPTETGNTGTVSMELTEEMVNEAVDELCGTSPHTKDRLEELGHAYFGERWTGIREIVDIDANDACQKLEEFGRLYFGERWAHLREIINLEVHLTGDQIAQMIDEAIEAGDCEMTDEEEDIIWLGNI